MGHKETIIQDIVISRHNTCYQREIWQGLNGEQIVASLAEHLRGRHFGGNLRSFIIYMYNNCHVTQPLIHDCLKSFDIDISTGEINYILNEDKHNTVFSEELLEVVSEGISSSDELRVDDTGARHEGKNAYCTCLNADLFTYFKTSNTKSRINFLELLRLEHKDYHLNEDALIYMQAQGLPKKYYQILEAYQNKVFTDKVAFEKQLADWQITATQIVKTITEGALIGSLIHHGFDPNKLIHSDGAGQFNLFLHSLCWKHAERPLKKIIPYNEHQVALLDKKLQAFWDLYKNLKSYKSLTLSQQITLKDAISNDFDSFCKNVERFEALNNVLGTIAAKKKELLLVLEYPEVSLHNNSTEREIREYAKRRKISGSTRSESGKNSRDVFTSLKKTCRKLSISFWEYLKDRIEKTQNIPPLKDLMRQKQMAKS